MREFMLMSFNREECRLDRPSTSPLSSIEYRPHKEISSLSEDIADNMDSLPWMESYGLNFNDIMALPYDVFEELSAKLIKRLESGKLQPHEQTQSLLRELITKVEESNINMLAFLKSISGKPGTSKGFEKREHSATAVKRPPLPKSDT